MEKIEKNDIVKGTVTGIQNYGAFISVDDKEGLIHISEISHGYVRNINDFLKIGDSIFVEVVDIDENDNHLKLSIKDIDYKKDGSKLKRMAETKRGFAPLEDNLEYWINEKIKEVTNKM